jgi:sortase A
MARVIPGILLILGLVQGIQGGWIHAKAWLAGFMVENAWTRTLEGENRVRPWPWADTWPVARLSFPGHGSDMVVLEGASGRVLAFAPGHLHGTASPGEEGACVVAGHRDTHFAVLEHLQPGDPIEIDGTGGSRHSYRVRKSAVLDRRCVGVGSHRRLRTDSRHLLALRCRCSRRVPTVRRVGQLIRKSHVLLIPTLPGW